MKVSAHISATGLTVSKNNIMEIHIFPYLENNLKVILLSISSLFHFRVKPWNVFELSCCTVFRYPQENFQYHKRIWEIFILQGVHWVDEDYDGVQQLWVHWRVHLHLPLHHRSSAWPSYVCTFSQSNVASVTVTRLPPARTAAALSCKSPVERDSYSFFSWWLPSVEEDSAAWGVDEQQMVVPDQKICTWRCELGVGNRARERGRKSGGRWQKVGQQGVWFGDEETEVNGTCDEWPLHRRRTGRNTFCLHRENCL